MSNQNTQPLWDDMNLPPLNETEMAELSEFQLDDARIINMPLVEYLTTRGIEPCKI